MAFFRRHLTLVGLCAVLTPLFVLVGLQYQALSRLEETSPAARRLSLESRLRAVADDVDRSFMVGQRQSLVVPPTAIICDKEDDDVSVFKTAPGEGIKRYFIATLFQGKRRSKVTTFDPKTGTFHDTWESPELWAAFSASFHSLNLVMDHAVVDPSTLELDEKDPHNRIAIRPIVDEASRIQGVAGFIVDDTYVAKEYLPRSLDSALRSHFSESELSELNVVVLDETGAARCCGDGAVRGPLEVSVPMPFLFSKWKLGLAPRGPSHEQVARRYFSVNLTLTVAMMLILAGAIVVSLRAASRELRLSQMKTDFVSNVSHELRTPLASIRVFAELMRSGRVRDLEKVYEYGALIESESRRLSRLVENILDFSRIESGRKVYNFERLAAFDVVSDAVTAFVPHAEQAGFEVRFDRPPEMLPPIRVDSSAMSQAILNLLDNALKYSAESRHIEVDLYREREGIGISVTDHGIGIPVEEQKNIFNRFHRVSSSLVHDVKGSGLGLALVKHVVEAHGGSVEVVSRVGSGSTFTIHLPTTASGAQVPVMAGVEPGNAAFRP